MIIRILKKIFSQSSSNKMIVNCNLANTLKNQWSQLLLDSNISESTRTELKFNLLLESYSETHRAYHTLDHILEMLNWLSDANIQSVSARWATWYHDVIYIPGKSDNESKSADIAVGVLREFGINEEIVLNVFNIILATKTHKISENNNEIMAYVLDADMAIMGASTDRYEEYLLSVRKEFVSIPKVLYNRGRKKFLTDVLKQTRIYSTPWFYDRLEVQARKNIEIELSHL